MGKLDNTIIDNWIDILVDSFDETKAGDSEVAGDADADRIWYKDMTRVKGKLASWGWFRTWFHYLKREEVWTPAIAYSQNRSNT